MALPKLETPTYETQIPSGKLVKFRPFLVKEEKVLLMVKESKNSKDIIRAMKQIVESCIEDDTESKTLSYYDIEHLFIHMRARSVGEQIEVMHTCSSCGEDFPFNIDITKVSLSAPIPENTNVMISENIGVSVKPVSPETVAASESNDSDRATIVVKDVIDTVFTDSEVHKFTDFTESERNEFVESLSLSNLQKILEKVEEFPRCQIKATRVCPKCGAENEITLEGIENFFT